MSTATKSNPRVTHSLAAQDTAVLKAANISSKEQSQEKKILTMTTKFFLTTELVTKIEDHNTLMFIVEVKANESQITQAVKKLYDTDQTEWREEGICSAGS